MDSKQKQEYNKLYYKLNKTLQNGTIKEKRQAVQNYKLFVGCKKCGYNKSAVALDFHHRDNKTKSFFISQMLRLSIEELKKEIRKCDVLCANDHRTEHWGNRLKIA